jgi:ArsR family transcriptional regulator, arsenate/arsenite/antimonite-responsive transcriptional repressor
MKSNVAIGRLTALAQETRLAIFRLLVKQGPEGLCASDIGTRLALAPATLSFHLKELTRAGLLKPRQKSRYIYYAPDFKAINGLIGYLTENCCGGVPCLSDSQCRPSLKRAI